MAEKTVTLSHLQAAALRAEERSARVAEAAAKAIEELAGQSASMEQVNTAIAAAVDGAIKEAY